MFEMAFIMVTFLFVASVRYFSGLTWTCSVHAGFKEPLSWGLYLPRWGVGVSLSSSRRFERVSRDLFFDKSRTANQRRAVTIGALRLLATREAVTTTRNSKNNSSRGKVDSRNQWR